MRIGRAIAIAMLAGAAAGAACSQSGPIRLADSAEAQVQPGATLATSCAAEQYQILVGQLANEVDTTTLPQPVTLVDYGGRAGAAQPGRMLLHTGVDGRISEVRCDGVS